jgi:hypothetical protein
MPTPNQALIPGHQYLLQCCLEGLAGMSNTSSNCVSFLYNGCPGISATCCNGWAEGRKGFTIHGFNGNVINEIETYVPCGKTYQGIFLGASLDFVSQPYNCNGPNCNASYKWKIKSPVGVVSIFNSFSFNNFIFNETGTYSINLEASCGGKVCDTCTSFINVINPVVPKCDCGTWSTLIANKVRYDCGAKIDWNCKEPVFFSNTYLCNPNDTTCKANISWVIIKDGSAYLSGTGSNGSFTPIANGTYEIIFSADCNGNNCESCVSTIVVKACADCVCNRWEQLVINRKKIDCRAKIDWNCNVPVFFSNTYLCNPNDTTCKANISWVIIKGGSAYLSGTGSNGSFTPIANGTYEIIFSADCNGNKCESCVSTFVVKACSTTCDCGIWSQLIANELKYDCGSKMLIPLSCKQAFNFEIAYQCSPNDTSCKAKIIWEIRKDGNPNPISSGVGTNNISNNFIPTSNGTYVLTLYAECNDQKCEPCIFTFLVTDCDLGCNCGKWEKTTTTFVKRAEFFGNQQHERRNNITPINKNPQVLCGGSINIFAGSYLVNGPTYACYPDSCQVIYDWKLTSGNTIVASGTGNSFNHQFQPGTYILQFSPTCGTNKCETCRVKIIVQLNPWAQLIRKDMLESETDPVNIKLNSARQRLQNSPSGPQIEKWYADLKENDGISKMLINHPLDMIELFKIARKTMLNGGVFEQKDFDLIVKTMQNLNKIHPAPSGLIDASVKQLRLLIGKKWSLEIFDRWPNQHAKP